MLRPLFLPELFRLAGDRMRLADSPLESQVRAHKALGHAVRLRILAMLADGELCVCQITSILELAPSTVSAHLSELKDAGLVLEEKEGRWVRYRLAAGSEVGGLVSPLTKDLLADAQIRDDRHLLGAIRRISLEALCRADLDLERLGIRRRSKPGGRGSCCRPAKKAAKAERSTPSPAIAREEN